MSNRTQGLRVRVVSSRLVISIGVETLAHAIETSPDDRLSPHNDETREFEHHTVTDPVMFAQEMVRALTAEEEDGTTVVYRLLDDAANNAIDNGAVSVERPQVYRG